jgi:O-methyltransferase
LGYKALIPVANLRYPGIMHVRRQVSGLTMVGTGTFIDNVLLARRASCIEGDLVECGTWRGGMSAAMAWAVPGRHSVLFDSFEGLPDAKPIDGPDAVRWSEEVRNYNNCSAEEVWAADAMSRVRQRDVDIVKGWFEHTVPEWSRQGRPIAVLRLDGDWYDSTFICLEHLWPLVSPGGIVIVDDYYTWDGCSRAVHDYLSQTKAAERVERSMFKVAYLVRR